MPIEYLPGIQAGQKIDLDQFKKKERTPSPESYLDTLNDQLETMAQQVNGEFGEFLEADGKISLVGRDAESDGGLVNQQEVALAQGANIEDWKKTREKKASNITEMAMTVVFNKFLQKDFIVARASDYDDYNNGVDQVIIDKKTGAVICGFDEVIGNKGDDGGSKKEEKIRHKMEAGGARIKYGATIEQGKLVRKELSNIPAFYIAISKEELDQVLIAIGKNEKKPLEAEEKLFSKLISSLEEQMDKVGKINLNNKLRDNLNKFKESLNNIKKQDYSLAA